MDLQSIKDSVETSVAIKVFQIKEKASYAHIFNSKFEMFPLSKAKDLNNFNPDRLTSTPYPEDDRPRGDKDLESLKYQRKLLRRGLQLSAIWIVKKGNTYTLLDGAHRIIATFLENKRSIAAYIIDI